MIVHSFYCKSNPDVNGVFFYEGESAEESFEEVQTRTSLPFKGRVGVGMGVNWTSPLKGEELEQKASDTREGSKTDTSRLR
jgi:hypothetical protein